MARHLFVLFDDGAENTVYEMSRPLFHRGLHAFCLEDVFPIFGMLKLRFHQRIWII
jgi:hypothetical protein